jgi:surface antigen
MKTMLIRGLVLVSLAGFMAAPFAGCANTSKSQQGAVLGGLGGAAIGGQLGPDDERGENALIGAGIGMVLGYIIGNEWDKYDNRQLAETLEYTKSGHQNEWVNPDTGNRYTATPREPYEKDDRIYRDVEIDGYIDGKRETVYATAYRQPDGTWRIVQ